MVAQQVMCACWWWVIEPAGGSTQIKVIEVKL